MAIFNSYVKLPEGNPLEGLVITSYNSYKTKWDDLLLCEMPMKSIKIPHASASCASSLCRGRISRHQLPPARRDVADLGSTLRKWMLRTSRRAALKAAAHLRLEIVQHKQNQGASWGETTQKYIHNIQYT
jgi:hypothetical protein